MVETIVYEIWVAGRFDEIIHHRKLSFEKVLTRVNLACINLPVVNIHLESDRDAGRAPPFRSAYRTRRSLLFLRFFNDSLTREAGGATRPTPLAHCRPAHSPDVALNLFIRKANGLCSTPLACHFATLLRAIRSTDKERRSIERRSCVKNLATRLGCIGALHPPAVLRLYPLTMLRDRAFLAGGFMSSAMLGNLGLNHEFLNSRAPLRFAAAFDGRSSRFRVYDNSPS